LDFDMPSGGKRPGAGKPKGMQHPRTLEKLECNRLFREELAPQVRPVIQAQIAAALGVSHMMARDHSGRWTRVTDPEAMVRVLNSGETFYRIWAQNPDPRAGKDILDRLCGSPTQALKVDLKGSLDVQDVPDAEPAHSLATSIASSSSSSRPAPGSKSGCPWRPTASGSQRPAPMK
jgi:hypothetical protein